MSLPQAEATSLAEKLSARMQALPFAFERVQISNLVSGSRPYSLGDDVTRAVVWTLWNETASVETNLDSLTEGLEGPVWIEFPNTVRTENFVPAHPDVKVPKRVGFLFSPHEGTPDMVNLLVAYDDGTEEAIPSVTYATGTFMVSDLAALSWGARNRYHLTTEKCMQRMMDRVHVDVPPGFMQELATLSEGNDAVYAGSVLGARTDLVSEVPFAFACLLAVRCEEVKPSPGDGAVTEMRLDIPDDRGWAAALRRIARSRRAKGFVRVGHPNSRRLSLNVPDGIGAWKLPSAGQAAGLEESAASNLPNEGTMSSANA